MGTKKPGYRGSRAVVLGADNGARTRDPNLGKVVLYQLSHVRICKTKRAPERPDVAWRRSPDSNRGYRLCRPLPYHLATSPKKDR